MPRFSLYFAPSFTVNIMAHGTPLGGSSVSHHGDKLAIINPVAKVHTKKTLMETTKQTHCYNEQLQWL